MLSLTDEDRTGKLLQGGHKEWRLISKVYVGSMPRDVHSCTHWLRPGNPPSPGLVYEGAIGQQITTSLCNPLETTDDLPAGGVQNEDGLQGGLYEGGEGRQEGNQVFFQLEKKFVFQVLVKERVERDDFFILFHPF
jgi:hypothetical protein